MLGRRSHRRRQHDDDDDKDDVPWWERPDEQNKNNVLMKFPGVLSDTEFRLHLEEQSRRVVGRNNISSAAGGEIFLSPDSLRPHLRIQTKSKKKPTTPAAELSHIVFVSFSNVDLALMATGKDGTAKRVSTENIGKVIISGSVGESSDMDEENSGLKRNIALSEPVSYTHLTLPTTPHV